MGYEKNSRKISLKILLTFFLTVILLVSGIVYSLYFYNSSKNVLMNELKTGAVYAARSLSENVKYDIAIEDKDSLGATLKKALKGADIAQVMVSDLTGKVIASKHASTKYKLNIPEKVRNSFEKSKKALEFELDGNDYIIASSPIILSDAFFIKYNLTRSTGEEGMRGYAQIVVSPDKMISTLKATLHAMLAFVVFIAVAGIIFSMLFLKFTFKPIDAAIETTRRIADGDLTVTLNDSFILELSILAGSINKISEHLASVLNSMFATVHEVATISDSIQSMSSDILKGTKEQSSSVNKTFDSVKDINDAIRIVAGKLDGLASTSGMTSDSMKKMTAAIGSVSDSANMLSDSIDNSSSSIVQMTSSIKEIAKNTDELSNFMAVTKDSIDGLDKAIHQVTKRSKEAHDLSEEVKANAAETGLKSVEQMSASMDKIKESVEHSTYTIKKLGDTSSQIGDILVVIQNVTEQTDLLALNAAILAAQAGKHGKGFAVVADEIKALADRTNSSTKEISEIIGDIHQDVANSIKAVTIGRENVSEGVKQTGQVVKAFEYIYNSANASLTKTNEIRTSSLDQASQVEAIKRTIDTMNDMVLQVVRATNEQKIASEHVMKMTEDISTITKKIKSSTFDQSQQSMQISSSLKGISDEIREIGVSINKKAREVGNVSKATNTVKEIAEKNIGHNKNLSNVAKKFLELSKILEEELSQFKIKDDK